MWTKQVPFSYKNLFDTYQFNFINMPNFGQGFDLHKLKSKKYIVILYVHEENKKSLIITKDN